MKSMVLVIIAGVFLFSTILGPASSAQSGKQIRAVLIGINQYEIGFHQTHVNDALDMEALLRGYGWTDIVTFTDREANLAPVQAAIEEVSGRCDSDDVFILYYSGHGGQRDDKNGDEADGLDEILCLVDELGSMDDQGLLDDVIDDILSRCMAETVVMIVDCCHSGGMQKGNAPLMSNEEVPTNPREIVLSSTQASQDSHCRTNPNSNSFFTGYILDAMTTQRTVADNDPRDGKITFVEIFNYAAEKIKKIVFKEMQEPFMYIGPEVKEMGVFETITNMALPATSATPPEPIVTTPLPILLPPVGIPPTPVETETTPSPAEPAPVATVPLTEEEKLAKLLRIAEKRLEETVGIRGNGYNLIPRMNNIAYYPLQYVDLEITVDEKCFLYILNIDTEFTTRLVYPISEVFDVPIEPGTYSTTNDLCRGWGIRIAEDSPPGTEYFLVIASPIPLGIELLTGANPDFGASIDNIYGVEGVIASIVDQVQSTMLDKAEWAKLEIGMFEQFPTGISQRGVAMDVVEYEVIN